MKKERESGQMVLDGTDEQEILRALGERVDRAIQTIHDLRKERDQLRQEIEELRRDSEQRQRDSSDFADLRAEHEKLVAERAEIRRRVERIAATLDSLGETT